MLEMRTILGSFSRSDGGGGGFGGAMQERLLGWGGDAYVKGNSPSVGPVRNVNVGGTCDTYIIQ